MKGALNKKTIIESKTVKILLAFDGLSPLIKRIVKQFCYGFNAKARFFVLLELDDSLDSEGRLPRGIEWKGSSLDGRSQSLLKNKHRRGDLQHSYEKTIVNVDKFACLEGLLNTP